MSLFLREKYASVKWQVLNEVPFVIVASTAPGLPKSQASTPDAQERAESARSQIAEDIRLRLADAWGQMGAAWGVAPAIARVHAYLMTRMEPLTEREVREALGLSHRAASLALAEAETWGLIERVAEPRRVGSRGPAGAAYRAVGDHWEWFGRVISERKLREGDPVVAVLERTLKEANDAIAATPDDQELVELRNWLSAFLVFVRLFDRAVSLVPRLEPRTLERGLHLLSRVPDDTVLRLFGLLDAVDDDDVLALVESLSRLSPANARRALGLFGGALRTLRR
jgi:DNA-binding transcriptional regulator GbsR (MarR family)